MAREDHLGIGLLHGSDTSKFPVVRPVQEDTVEMQARADVLQSVVRIHYYPIAHIGVDDRQRPLAINANCGSVIAAIRIRNHPGNVEIVCDCGSLNREGEEYQRQYWSEEVGQRESHGCGKLRRQLRPRRGGLLQISLAKSTSKPSTSIFDLDRQFAESGKD
jgi:hypothetical protein